MNLKRILFLALVLVVCCGLASAADAKSKKTEVKKDDKTVKTVEVKKPASDVQLTIAGEAIASQAQAVNFIKKYSPDARLNCSVEEIVALYYQEAALEGIRPDVALSQALLETGFFSYRGDVKPYQNNFCGLGSVGGGAKGATFKTPELGVRAHIQHLLAYARKEPPKTKIVDPRYAMVTKRPDIYGVCVTWYDLDGRWAAKGVNYGERILSVHTRMLAMEPKNVKPEQVPEPPERKDEEKKDQETDGKRKMRDKIREILGE